MLQAAFWGLVQGLTEFLPISSSGHLVLIPAFLGLEPPDLATSAVLHLGTLVAVVIYYRSDLARLLHFRTDRHARTILWLLIVGTIPAVIGLVVEQSLADFQQQPQLVAAALIATGLVLLIATRIQPGSRRLEDGKTSDAVVVGIAQAFALIPGISRSGMTISAGLQRKLEPVEAARFAFLLGIPAIAGGGLIQAVEVAGQGAFDASLLVGLAVSAVTGYLAISWLIRLLGRVGLLPFAIYCLAVGTLGVAVL